MEGFISRAGAFVRSEAKEKTTYFRQSAKLTEKQKRSKKQRDRELEIALFKFKKNDEVANNTQSDVKRSAHSLSDGFIEDDRHDYDDDCDIYEYWNKEEERKLMSMLDRDIDDYING